MSPATRPDPTSTVARTGVATSAGIAALFLLLRVLVVSDWNWHTAFAVVHTVDFEDAVGIVFGTLMANETLTGILLVWLLPVTVIHAAWPEDGQLRSLSSLLLAATTVTASIALVSTSHLWWLPAGGAVVACVLIAVRLLRGRGEIHKLVVFALRRAGASAALGALALAAVVQTPWMPLERIETRSGELTGYVVATDPGFVKILTSDDRHFLILTTDEVISREELAGH